MKRNPETTVDEQQAVDDENDALGQVHGRAESLKTVVINESTYGNGQHPTNDPRPQLAAQIRKLADSTAAYLFLLDCRSAAEPGRRNHGATLNLPGALFIQNKMDLQRRRAANRLAGSGAFGWKGPSEMKLASVNVGLSREVAWHGRIVTTGIFKQPVEGRVRLRKLNLDGDRQADLTVH